MRPDLRQVLDLGASGALQHELDRREHAVFVRDEGVSEVLQGWARVDESEGFDDIDAGSEEFSVLDVAHGNALGFEFESCILGNW